MEKLTEEKFKEIFEKTESKWEGDNAFQGLQILSKYTDNLIQGVGRDVIWSVDLDEIIDLGISEEDVEKLALLNWMIEDGSCLACFV